MTTEKIKTAPFRVSFPSIFKKSAVPGSDSDPKYSCVMLFPKDKKETKRFMKTIKQMIQEERVAKWGAKGPKKIQTCIFDGDDEDELEASGGSTAGFFGIKATSVAKPGVINRDGTESSPDEFYAGCWARASIVFRAYDKGKNGVACHFNNFLKWADDEPFGQAKATASEDFDEWLEDMDDDQDDDQDDDI